MAEHIRGVIQHFKQDDPVGVPKNYEGQIPDPIPIPNLEKDFSGTKMSFEGITVHGLRKFRLDHVVSDLSALKVKAKMPYFWNTFQFSHCCTDFGRSFDG